MQRKSNKRSGHRNTSSHSAMGSTAWGVLESFSSVTSTLRAAQTVLGGEDYTTPQLNKSLHALWLEPVQQFSASDSGRDNDLLATSLGDFEVVVGNEPPNVKFDVEGEEEEEEAKEEAENLGIHVPEWEEELNPDEWQSFFDEDGVIRDEEILRKRIFYGGVDPTIRIEVWKFLLNFYPFSSSFESRSVIRSQKREEYGVYKRQWTSITAEQESHFEKFRKRKHIIQKDVVRTDRNLEFYSESNENLKLINDILLTYSFFHFDLGYVQGMNDLLSLNLFIMRDEADAFWCFKALMDKLQANFHKDQRGMHTQLLQLANLIKCMDRRFYNYLEQRDCLNMFFCFRWLLIHFKREFAYEDIPRLWEAMWAQQLSPHFHLFVALAILLKHKKVIMKNDMSFDDILKYINNLAGKMDVHQVLHDAEYLVHKFNKLHMEEIAEVFAVEPPSSKRTTSILRK
ncbi:RabGAP/TBC domain-containing protein [Balamuthia mandrillaris]